MPLTSADIQTIAEIVSHMIHEKGERVTEHGVVTAGSWSAIDDASRQIEAGTAEATSGKTAAILGDDGDTGLAKPRLNVATTQIGDQYGPIGGERVLIIPTEDGPVALYIHGPEDSPGAKAGERWILHRNPTTLGWDAFLKFTNDGVTTNDGKGGISVNAASFLSMVTTGGLSIVGTDTQQTFTIQSASGGAIILNDNKQRLVLQYLGATILFDGPTGTVQIQGSSTASGDAVVRQSDLAAHIADVKAYINAHTHTGVQTGSGTSATVASPYNPAAATGSSKTFTA